MLRQILAIGVVSAAVIGLFSFGEHHLAQANDSAFYSPIPIRYVDNVNYPDDPQWIIRITSANGKDMFVHPGPAERRTSGPGTISFVQDEAVLGFRITLANGRVMENTECYLRAAPMAGQVTDGVVNPWGSEILNRRICTDQDFHAPRRVSGSRTISFAAGEPVVGYKIVLDNGTVFGQCYLANPPVSGKITDGVVNPSPGDLANVRPC